MASYRCILDTAWLKLQVHPRPDLRYRMAHMGRDDSRLDTWRVMIVSCPWDDGAVDTWQVHFMRRFNPFRKERELLDEP